MLKYCSGFLLLFFIYKSNAQIITDIKGTRFIIDSSKWTLQGNDIFFKLSGNVGIGTDNPMAQLHTTSSVRFEGLNVNANNTKVLTTDNMGNLATRQFSNMLNGKAISTINGLTTSNQLLETGSEGNDFNIVSSNVTHKFNIPTASSISRGLISPSDWNKFSAKEEALIFSDAFVRETNSISLKPSQHIESLTNISENGILKTINNNGTLTIASASDFPILNQNTSGSAASLTTSRLLYGNSFDGTANVTGIIASGFGGTGNGYTKFTGPSETEKIFSLPNESATILTSNTAVTPAQGGTGQSSYSDGQLLIGNSNGNTLSKATLTEGNGITISNSPGSIKIAYQADIYQINGTNQLSTDNTSDESLSTPMVITLDAGDYIIMFNAVVSNSKAGKGVIMSIYLNNSKIESTEMQATSGKDNDKNTISCYSYVTNVQSGQTIEVKWRAESNTAKVTNRNMIVQKVK